LLALYTFTAGSGDTIRDMSGIHPPLDVRIQAPSSVRWLAGGGLRILERGLIASRRPARKISDACRASGRFTVEVWLRPAASDWELPRGPARIVSLSANVRERSFQLGQERSGFAARVTTTAHAAHESHAMYTAPGTVPARQVHLALCADTVAGTVQLYMDGTASPTGPGPDGPFGSPSQLLLDGDFDCWSNEYRLILANEFGLCAQGYDRFWAGDLFLVAVYSRSLSEQEIKRNYEAGPPQVGMRPLAARGP
jgi:hypothetical protein